MKKEEVECKEGSIYWKMARDAIREAKERLQGEENEGTPVREPSAYEKLREKNIERNNQKLASAFNDVWITVWANFTTLTLLFCIPEVSWP